MFFLLPKVHHPSIFVQYVPCNAVEISLMTNPITPISAIPRKQIFIESQSSLRPGFVAKRNNLRAEERNDLNPILYSLAHFQQ
jgi:hypothetical protein